MTELMNQLVAEATQPAAIMVTVIVLAISAFGIYLAHKQDKTEKPSSEG